jgi:hypothetical protein
MSFCQLYDSIPESALVDLVPSDEDDVPDLVPAITLGVARKSHTPTQVSPPPDIPPSTVIPPSPPHVSHVSHDSPDFLQSLEADVDVVMSDDPADDDAPPLSDNSAAASVTASVHIASPTPGPIASPTPSFPNSPVPRLRPSTSNPSPPHTYTDREYVPNTDRDYAMDYEAVMGTIQDLNSMSRFMFRGGVRRVWSGGMYRQYTREDVLPILQELKDMLERLFSRLNG